MKYKTKIEVEKNFDEYMFVLTLILWPILLIIICCLLNDEFGVFANIILFFVPSGIVGYVACILLCPILYPVFVVIRNCIIIYYGKKFNGNIIVRKSAEECSKNFITKIKDINNNEPSQDKKINVITSFQVGFCGVDIKDYDRRINFSDYNFDECRSPLKRAGLVKAIVLQTLLIVNKEFSSNQLNGDYTLNIYCYRKSLWTRALLSYTTTNENYVQPVKLKKW